MFDLSASIKLRRAFDKLIKLGHFLVYFISLIPNVKNTQTKIKVTTKVAHEISSHAQ